MSSLAPAIYTMSDDEIQKIYCVRGSSPMMTAIAAGIQVGFPLVGLDLDITVSGFTASMEVTQTFVNRGTQAMEATYIFPLPDRLAVTRFRMEVAGRVIEAVINERGAAREMYDQAIAQGQRAAIAEEERPGVFTLRVGNVMPGEMPVVRLSLIGPLAVDEDEVTLQFPLLVAPRYTAGQREHREWSQQVGDGEGFDTDLVPDASRVAPPVRIAGHDQQVRLSGKVVIDGVDPSIGNVSSSLPLLTSPTGGALRLSLASGAIVNRDLIIRWRMASDPTSLEVTSSLVLVDDAGTDFGTFALTLVPPPAMATLQRPRDVVFVIDRSGSMRGWQMVAARRAVSRMVDTLTSRDRFTVIAFDDFIESPAFDTGEKLAIASDRNRFKAVEFLATVDARGGTDMARPLVRAAEMLANVSATRDRTIVIATDGQVSGEDAILASLAPYLRGTRVMTIGIDQSVNAGFLRRLASMGAGLFELVESEDRLDEVMDKVHRRIGLPVVQALTLQGQGLAIDMASIAPQRVGDLFVGAPMTITGRYTQRSSATPAIVLGGSRLGEKYHSVVTQRPESQSFLQRFGLAASWARARIRDLEDRYAVGGHMDALESIEQQIVSVSMQYSVLSRFTAFVVVDKTEIANRSGQQRRVIQAVAAKPEAMLVARASSAMPMSVAALSQAAAPRSMAKMAASALPFGGPPPMPKSSPPPAMSRSSSTALPSGGPPAMPMSSSSPSSFHLYESSAPLGMMAYDDTFLVRLGQIAEALYRIKSESRSHQRFLLQTAMERLQEWVADVVSLDQHAETVLVANEVLALLSAVLSVDASVAIDLIQVDKAADRLQSQAGSVEASSAPSTPASPPIHRNPPAPKPEPAKPFWKRK